MASLCGRGIKNAVSKLSLVGRSLKSVGSTAYSKRTSSTRSSLRGLFNSSSRVPVELRCASSLMPLHSATASALFTSLLSVQSQNWGTLSEGFATPL